MDETKYWLWLSMVFGTGSHRIWEAMCLYETASDAYNSLYNDYSSLSLNENEKNNIRTITLSQAEEYLEQCRKCGISAVGYSSDEYPSQLRHIFNPSAVLYYKGNIACLRNKRAVTAVGTRKASSYGLAAASRICRELAQEGVLIISGFAIGTDITAHMAAAGIQRPTVCVLGCGVDVDYPRGNFRYRDMILESGGVFLSEYPPGTEPHGYNFPKRNRILSALGRVTLVFEASLKSGSLITATLAAEQGRDVYCLPPADIFSRSFSGNAELIREGALPLLSSMDILEYFDSLDSVYEEKADAESIVPEIHETDIFAERSDLTVKSNTDRLMERSFSEEVPETASEKNSDTIKADNTVPDKAYEGLTDVQKQIVKLLEGCSLHADIISQRLGLDASELLTEMTELEILGAVRSLPGKYINCIEI